MIVTWLIIPAAAAFGLSRETWDEIALVEAGSYAALLSPGSVKDPCTIGSYRNQEELVLV